jgi:hypothetical protein
MITSLEDMCEFVPEKYWEFEDIFAKSIFDSLPVHTSYNHQINLDESFVPCCSKLYPLSLKGQRVLEEFIMENLDTSTHQVHPKPHHSSLERREKRSTYQVSILG